jgi:hypothetical protein
VYVKVEDEWSSSTRTTSSEYLMRIFKCQHCEQLLYFENSICERCSHRLGYLPEVNVLSAVEPQPGGLWRALAAPEILYRFCANTESSGCNWLLPAQSSETYCIACRHNRTIPNLDSDENLRNWRRCEFAKRRLFYSLIRLNLPLANRIDDPVGGLTFDIPAEPVGGGLPGVLTGHDGGVITLNLKEADEVHCETTRTAMGEAYRTLLGHFRHESGHYFWDKLVRDAGQQEACRGVFGDERIDYDEALKRHYASGPPPCWQEQYISAYASTHPFEDFAETWAHYLHIVDTIEMASAFGIHIQPTLGFSPDHSAMVDFDPHQAVEINRLIAAWLPLALSVNAINRCMGEPDLYPFILSSPVISKMDFIHQLIHRSG